VLGNTSFHLYLRPGLDVIAAHQGLHRSCQERPILTDGAVLQVWELAENAKNHREGAQFRRPFDGRRLFLSPEESMRRIQRYPGLGFV